MKNLTELVFILDRSGSMSGLEDDTIGGFNSLIKKQKTEKGEARVTTILFDDEVEILHDMVDIKKIKPLNSKQYFVRGCTALLDAIGKTINRIEGEHRKHAESAPEKVLFIITTDGMENSSKEYDYKKIKNLVEKHQKAGWEFLFFGANIDAIKTAGDFGIKASRAVNYKSDKRGTKLNYKVLERTVSMFRGCAMPQAEAMLESGAWKAEIEEDYANRNQDA